MKQIHACLALTLLLLAGWNCGTENPVEETADLSATETPTVNPLPEPNTALPEPDAPLPEPDAPLPEPDTPLPEVEVLEPGQGLSLGSQAPAFALSDGNGKLRTLAEYIGNKKVALVFFRGGW